MVPFETGESLCNMCGGSGCQWQHVGCEVWQPQPGAQRVVQQGAPGHCNSKNPDGVSPQDKCMDIVLNLFPKTYKWPIDQVDHCQYFQEELASDGICAVNNEKCNNWGGLQLFW